MTSSPFVFNFDTYLLVCYLISKWFKKKIWSDYLKYQYDYVCKWAHVSDYLQMFF